MSANSAKIPFLTGRTRIWLRVAIIVLAAVLAVAVPLLVLHLYQQPAAGANGGTGPQSFSVGANAVLSLKEQGGDVSVYPSNNSVITVRPRKHGTVVAPSPQSVRILYSQTVNAQGHEQINVTTDPWFSDTDFYVTIPATTVVQITLTDGSIDVHAGHGLTASTSSGSIEVDSIQGPTTVSTASGDVTAENITGPLTIADQSGSLHLQQIKGQVQATTASGDVTAQDATLSGQSVLRTQNGSVHFYGSLDPRGSYRLQTTAGDVDATLPTNAAFSLDASTTSGSVQNDFGASVVGGTPRAQLFMHTQNGSIAVIKA